MAITNSLTTRTPKATRWLILTLQAVKALWTAATRQNTKLWLTRKIPITNLSQVQAVQVFGADSAAMPMSDSELRA